jgi:hypothetical protein
MSAWILFAPIVEQLLKELSKHLCVEKNCLNLTLPFDIKLSVISTMAMLCSYGIYQIYCPNIVRSFDSFRDFVSSGGTASELLGFVKEFYYKKILPRNQDELNLGNIIFTYDNIFILKSRPYYKRSLSFEIIKNENRYHEIKMRGRFPGYKVNHLQYRPDEIAIGLRAVRFSRRIDIGRVDDAVDILHKNLDIYFEFVVLGGPDGDVVLYTYQIGQLYFHSWAINVNDRGNSYSLNQDKMQKYTDKKLSDSGTMWNYGRLNFSSCVEDDDISSSVGGGFETLHSFFFGYTEADGSREQLEDAFSGLIVHFDRKNERQLRWANLFLVVGLAGWIWCAGHHVLPYLLR